MKRNLIMFFNLILVASFSIGFVSCSLSKKATQQTSQVASSNIEPIINIHSIENKTPYEIKSILGDPNSTEKTKYGMKFTYLTGRVEILFLDGVASHITINSKDGNFELLGIKKESLHELNTTTKHENDIYIGYNNLEGLYNVIFFKKECYFSIVTKKEYDFDSLPDSTNNVSLKESDVDSEDSVTSEYYKTLREITIKYNGNYSQEHFNELDSLLNEIYNYYKDNTVKNLFSKVEKQELEWINYKENKKSLKEKITDTEMRIKDLLYMMNNMEKSDVINEYIPYFKR